MAKISGNCYGHVGEHRCSAPRHAYQACQLLDSLAQGQADPLSGIVRTNISNSGTSLQPLVQACTQQVLKRTHAMSTFASNASMHQCEC